MKNKHAAGILGSHGGLTKTNQEAKKKGSVETVLVGCLNITKGQVFNSPFMGNFACHHWGCWLKHWGAYSRDSHIWE